MQQIIGTATTRTRGRPKKRQGPSGMHTRPWHQTRTDEAPTAQYKATAARRTTKMRRDKTLEEKARKKDAFERNLEPDGYWWTHRLRVTKRHIIQTCLTIATVRKRKASQKNIMGGSEAGKWYIEMGMAHLKLVNNPYSVLHPSTSCSNECAIADTGASGNYLKTDAPHDLAIRPVSLIQVKQPNGQILQSTKGYRLELETLPEGSIVLDSGYLSVSLITSL